MERIGFTTPFGRRPLSVGQMAGQVAAGKCRPMAKSDKWRILRAASEAKALLGLNDRALAVLSALLSFYPAQELSGDGNLVVFPSNEQLSLRAHGMAPATLRRHLAVLVEAGLVVRRDSPNGKRFARRGQGGQIEQAYGFDLSPLLARAEEFEHLADTVRAERRALHLARERVSLLRRDIAKLIEFGKAQAIVADWDNLNFRFRSLLGELPRKPARVTLEQIAEQLTALGEEMQNAMESLQRSGEQSATEPQNERLKEESKPDSQFVEDKSIDELKGHLGDQNVGRYPPERSAQEIGSYKAKSVGTYARSGPNQYGGQSGCLPDNRYASCPLDLVLRACPDIAIYARHGISTWDDLWSAANLARLTLGVSHSAWDEACDIMGRSDASVVLSAILQRGDAVSNAGAYLRSLTAKCKAGNSAIGSMIMTGIRRIESSQSRNSVAA